MPAHGMLAESGTIALWYSPSKKPDEVAWRSFNGCYECGGAGSSKPTRVTPDPESEGHGQQVKKEASGQLIRRTQDVTGTPSPPVLDLHVNLWRLHKFPGVSGHKQDVTFLDLGFELQDVNNVAQLSLFLPARVGREDIADLAPTLKDQKTLKAVFNDIVKIDTSFDDYFEVKKTSTSQWRRRIWFFDQTDLDFESIGGDNFGGVVITLRGSIFDRIRKFDPENGVVNYIRLRISLRRKQNQVFCITDSNPTLFGVTALAPAQETIEFRLNERRSYPEEIETRAENGQLLIRSVNYFLITNIESQLTTQHTEFRRVRQLEMSLWSDYIMGRAYDDGFRENHGSGITQNHSHGIPTHPKLEKQVDPQHLSIYQWKVDGTAKSKLGKKNCGHESLDFKCIEDFNAYATFNYVHWRILPYLAQTLLIGLVSGVLSSILISLWTRSS